MRAKTFSFILAGMLVVALLGVAFNTSRREEELDAQRVAALQDRARLQHELQTATQAQTESAQKIARLKATIASVKTKPAPAPAPKGTGSISLSAVHANNPALANLWIAAQKAALNQSYGPLFRALGLSPEKAEELKAILAHRIARNVDLDAASAAQGLNFQDPAIKELVRQADEQTKAEEEALLGRDDFSQLQDYQRSINARGMVDGLAGVVAFTDPLTAQQADALTRILANASPAYRAGGYASLQDVDWSVVDEQARAVLSAAQFSVWQQGNPRGVRGGYARSDVQLQNAYEKAAKAEKERQSAAQNQPTAPSPP